MAKPKLRNRILAITAGVLATLALTLHFTGKNYVYKALFYNFAGIEDNRIFVQNTVAAAPEPEPWPKAKNYNQPALPDALKSSLE